VLGMKLEIIPEGAQELMEFHADNGFVGVDSDSLKDAVSLFKKFNASLLTACAQSAHTEDDQYVLALMLTIKNKMGMLACIKALKARRSTTRDMVDVSGLRALLDTDVLHDTLTREDFGRVRDFIEECEKHNEEMFIGRKAAVPHVKAAFETRLNKDQYRAALQEYETENNGVTPWSAPVKASDDVFEIIRKLRPDGGHVSRNQAAGAFTATFTNSYLRSYSWTLLRGMGEALALALEKCWNRHEDLGGNTPASIRRALDKLKKREDRRGHRWRSCGCSILALVPIRGPARSGWRSCGCLTSR
jgi:hypothetical protein